MNDCFTVHVHQQPDGSWTGRVTTITGRDITLIPATGADKLEVMQDAVGTLFDTLNMASLMDTADVPPDDRGGGATPGEITMPPYSFPGSWMESVARKAVNTVPCPACQAIIGTWCKPGMTLEQTCQARVYVLDRSD